VAVYSDADRGALHVLHADEAYRLGPAPATESYLRGDLILEIARRAGADAVSSGVMDFCRRMLTSRRPVLRRA